MRRKKPDNPFQSRRDDKIPIPDLPWQPVFQSRRDDKNPAPGFNPGVTVLSCFKSCKDAGKSIPQQIFLIIFYTIFV